MPNMSIGNLNIDKILLDADKSVKEVSIGDIVIWKKADDLILLKKFTLGDDGVAIGNITSLTFTPENGGN